MNGKKVICGGGNPTATCDYGFTSGSIGGCGYDKLSTAVSNVLNQHKEILKLMYDLKNKNIDKSNHDLFGYGSGYGIKPYFEGGVGVSCYPRIFEKIGLRFKHIFDSKNTDVFLIERFEE